MRRNPKQSMRKMAQEINMDPKSMRTIVKGDLKLSSFKLKTRQQLTVLQKRKREERARLLLNFIKPGTQTGEIVLSDEKMISPVWVPDFIKFKRSRALSSLFLF